MLIFYLMYQKSNNYRNGSTKLAEFWAIGYLFLSAVKMLFNGVIMLSKKFSSPVNNSR